MNVGDVQLKSGGPKMTVNEVYNDGTGTVYCVWFDGTVQKSATFSAAALQSARDSQNVGSSGGGGGPQSWMG